MCVCTCFYNLELNMQLLTFIVQYHLYRVKHISYNMYMYMHVVVMWQVGGLVVMIHTPAAPEITIREFVKQNQLR